MSLLRNTTVHGLGGFFLMGGWAVFANRAYEMPAPLVAGLVQGVLTATITLFLKQIIERIFHHTTGAVRLALPPLAAAGISLGLLTAIHTLAGTPSLLATISVPFAVSTLYGFGYTLTLRRHA